MITRRAARSRLMRQILNLERGAVDAHNPGSRFLLTATLIGGLRTSLGYPSSGRRTLSATSVFRILHGVTCRVNLVFLRVHGFFAFLSQSAPSLDNIHPLPSLNRLNEDTKRTGETNSGTFQLRAIINYTRQSRLTVGSVSFAREEHSAA